MGQPLASQFIVGARYEVYIPVAKQVELQLGCTFADNLGYSFELCSTDADMLWTTDISYGVPPSGGCPPPPHPTWGSPLPSLVTKFVRPVTDE